MLFSGWCLFVYDYDDNKNLVLAESYQDDELVGSIVYEYDHNQNCIYQYSTSVLGVDDVEIKMVYDNRNHMIEKYQYGLEQDSEIYTIYIYDDKGKCIQEMIEDVSGGRVLVSYIYDQDKIVEKRTDSGFAQSVIQYGYDEENRLIEERISYNDGESFLPVVTIEY